MNWATAPGEGLITAVGDGRDLERHPAARTPEAADPLHMAGAAQFRVALAKALSRLPDPQAQAFLMCDAWGMDASEACQALGVTPGHLSVLRHRARHRLRLDLAAHAGR